MDISAALAAANPASTTTATDTTKFGQDYNQFLTLLTTQLQNQDPLSPMDSSQFTNQLVEFSGVEQQIKSNDYLQKLLTLNAASLTNVGLGYVGLNVQAPGNSLPFDGTNAVQMSYVMPAGATVGTVSILDASGNTVDSMSADLTAGTHDIAWDGTDGSGNKVAAGTYTLSVGAQDAKQNPLSVTTYVDGLVTGVQTADDGTVSVMINGKPVDVTTVHQAFLPSAVSSALTPSTAASGS